VIKYLVASGISKNKLVAKGYGETMLIVQSAATEEEHQMNRRTEFKVLKIK
jgi:outer membrane protein OmpA-like peptidoglycan-associated protein